MALSLILRRASSTAVPLAIRAVGSSRAIHSVISSVGESGLSRELNRSSFFPSQGFCTAIAEIPKSDENLVQVLESEIVWAEEDRSEGAIEFPVGFPFEVQDVTGERTITMTRKYKDEAIEVQVDWISSAGDEDENENDGDEVDKVCVPMVVKITKGNGVCLEFGVTAFPDQITIDSLSVKNPELPEDGLPYEGPDYSDLDENLQKAFNKYLEIRGIKASTTNFLLEYMQDKDCREYLQWLNNLKNFVGK